MSFTAVRFAFHNAIAASKSRSTAHSSLGQQSWNARSIKTSIHNPRCSRGVGVVQLTHPSQLQPHRMPVAMFCLAALNLASPKQGQCLKIVVKNTYHPHGYIGKTRPLLLSLSLSLSREESL
jgi:hypothetical protein